jgi:hypothetical protein
VSSQREQVLAALRTAGSRGICLADVELPISYTMRNRIGTLRREGFDIRSELCRVHAHDGPISRYVLWEWERASATPPPLAPSAATKAARGAEPQGLLAAHSTAQELLAL